MKPVCLLFNGPPKAGKDASTDYLVSSWAYKPEKFAKPIEKALKSFLGLSEEEFRILRNDKKDEIMPEFGVTFRQMMISFSEDWAKKYGEDIFAKLLVSRVRKKPGRNFSVSDSGFNVECNRFREDLKDTHDVYVIRIDRPGCTYEGDSREYVEDPDFEIYNDCNFPDLHGKIVSILHKIHQRRLFTPIVGVVG